MKLHSNVFKKLMNSSNVQICVQLDKFKKKTFKFVYPLFNEYRFSIINHLNEVLEIAFRRKKK